MTRSAGARGARSAVDACADARTCGRRRGAARRRHRSGRTKRARRSALAGSVLPFLLLAGCTADAAPAPEATPEQASPFADCASLGAAPPSAAPASGTEGAELPDVELPCFTGGQPFRLTDLRGPAVVNLWASWCEPCRAELPLMQRLADRSGGRLHVLGVDVGDGREAAASFGAGKQVTMPTLYDRERRLLSALGRVTLPVTIFVDAAGRDYVHAEPVDATELGELVREHTGVTVTP